MTPHTIDVRPASGQLSRILVAPGLLTSLGTIVAEACPGASRLVTVSSPREWALHGPAVAAGLGPLA